MPQPIPPQHRVRVSSRALHRAALLTFVLLGVGLAALVLLGSEPDLSSWPAAEPEENLAAAAPEDAAPTEIPEALAERLPVEAATGGQENTWPIGLQAAFAAATDKESYDITRQPAHSAPARSATTWRRPTTTRAVRAKSILSAVSVTRW